MIQVLVCLDLIDASNRAAWRRALASAHRVFGALASDMVTSLILICGGDISTYIERGRDSQRWSRREFGVQTSINKVVKNHTKIAHETHHRRSNSLRGPGGAPALTQLLTLLSRGEQSKRGHRRCWSQR